MMKLLPGLVLLFAGLILTGCTNDRNAVKTPVPPHPRAPTSAGASPFWGRGPHANARLLSLGLVYWLLLDREYRALNSCAELKPVILDSIFDV